MTVSRRSAIKAIGVVGTGSALSGTVLGVNEHEDDERDPEEAADAEETGAIRVAHFSPDAPNVDVYVNDQRILADVAYEDVSPYLEIVPGTYALTITAAGDPDTIVYEQQFAVETGYYTAAAIGELEGEDEDEDEATGDDAAGADDAAAEDDAAAPADDNADRDDEYAAGDDDGDHEGDDNDDYEGDDYDSHDYEDDEADTEGEDETDAQETGTFDVLLLADRLPAEVEERVEGEDAGQIRVVHAAPDAPNVDLFVADTPSTIFEDLEFTVPSGYVAVESGSVSFDVFPAGEGPEKEALNPEGEADSDETIEPDEDADADDDSDEPEPVATFDLDVEAGQAYTAYAIGYLESDADHAESDGQHDESADEQAESDDEQAESEDEQAESDDEQAESEDEQAESDDEQAESEDEQAESDDERGDTAFEIVSLVDATTEDDDEMEDDADYDAEDEVAEEPMDEGDDHAANESAADDDMAANESADDDMAANDSATDDVAADGGDAAGNESDAVNETDDDY